MTIPFRVDKNAAVDIKLVSNVSRRTRADFRLWLGIALLLFSILGITSLIKSADQRTEVVVLKNDVTVGQVLTLANLELAKVSVPHVERYLTRPETAVGRKANRNMSAGELLPAVVQSASKVSGRVVSIPIRAGHLPNLATGDQVDIWSTPSADGLALPGPPRLVAAKVSVLETPSAMDTNTDTAISVVIPESKLSAVIAALRDGLIDVVGIPETVSSS